MVFFIELVRFLIIFYISKKNHDFTVTYNSRSLCIYF